jgi:hypothetical protein
MLFIIKVDDFLAIAIRDHELLLAIKLVSLFAILERVGHKPCYIGNNYLFGGYNTYYIGNNSDPITRIQ